MSSLTAAAPTGLSQGRNRPFRAGSDHNQEAFLALCASGLLAGALILPLSLRHAAAGRIGVIPLFWCGFLLAAAPAAAWACDRHTPDATRGWLIAALGLWDALPKTLRDPALPLYNDELAHWAQARSIVRTGQLSEPNQIIPIIPHFPGLEGTVAAFHLVSGAPEWTLGLGLMLACHLAVAVGINRLLMRLGASGRAAATGAVIYLINPQSMYFDTQFSYETLGIALLVWSLVAAVEAADGSRTWAVFAVLLIGSTVVTHHLSSYVLCALLALLALARPAGRRRSAILLTAWGVAAALAWLALAARGAVVHYYGPYVQSSAGQLQSLFGRHGTHRKPFAGNAVPTFEIVSGYLVPAVLAGLYCALLLRLRRRPRQAAPRGLLVLAAFGLLYFASLPIDLTASGAEAAHRSWAFSYLGVAAAAALTLTLPAGHAGSHKRTSRRVPAQATLVAACVLCLLIGGTSSSVNTSYRLPGPYLFGSDARSLTPELIALTSWCRTELARGTRVVADRDTGLALTALGGTDVAEPSTGFPVWQLLLDPRPVPRHLLEQMRGSHYDYLVVDERIRSQVPQTAVYFSPAEPDAGTRTRPPPPSAVTRWTTLPWASPIYASKNYTVYRLDLQAATAPAAPEVAP